MRNIIITCLLLHFFVCNSQVSLEQIKLENGNYSVGFNHYTSFDITRSYSRPVDIPTTTNHRPIPISVWYPAKESQQNNMLVTDYMRILSEEEEWEYLPEEQILNWFYYINTSKNRSHFSEKSTAISEAERLNGTFPVVIYAASFKASSIENFALCEYLASHGYIVIASPSRGTYSNRSFNGNNALDIETQARDVEFLISEIFKNPTADTEKIAVMGFSFGGLANSLTQMRNKNIKAIVSLDGSERYQYSTLKKSPFYSIDRVNIPYIHMSQKNIPDKVLIEDKLDASLNTEFKFYDDLIFSDAYSLKFNDLTHSNFSTLGILFQDRDPRQDKGDIEIMNSYKWVSMYTLNFLNAYLKMDAKSLRFINKNPTENGASSELISYESKRGTAPGIPFYEFNEMAFRKSYENLEFLCDSLNNVGFRPQEWQLNTLGLKLLFNPETSEKSISVFQLAIKLYPKSANLFDSIAEAYLHIGNEKMAITNFKKSLELNAENQNAIDRLKQLSN